MAAFTASVTGNWNNSATFGGAGIPVSGDTVTINNGITLTVPSGYTAVCGTSPVDDTGAIALQTASVSTGTGILIVNGTLKWQGPVRMGLASWTVGAGGTLTYDASAATTPASALYTWQTIQNTATGGSSQLIFSGSSGSHCTVNSIGNVQSGGFGNKATNWQGGGQVTASFTDFSYQGAATTSGNLVNSNLNPAADLHFDDCTIDHCGQIQATGPFVTAAGIASTAIFRLLRTKITNPVNTTYTAQIYTSVGSRLSGGGVRLVQNSDIAGQLYFTSSDGAGGLSLNDFTVKHNVLRYRDLSTGALGAGLFGGASAAWDQNLLAFITASTGTVQDPKSTLHSGTYTNSYLLRLVVPTANGANMHPIYIDQRPGDITIDGWCIQYGYSDTQGDMINMDKEATVARNVTVTRSIYMPGMSGLTAGSMVNQQGGVNQTNTKIYFDHNTAACGATLPSTATVWGVGTEGASTWPAGAVPSIRSNIVFNLTSGTGTIANSSSTSTVANSAVTAADYNDAYLVTNSIYGNPVAQFSGTPGTHDLAVDPQFVDKTRSIFNFDQGYLGASVGTAWATSTAYVVGDIVSNAVSAFFGNLTFNYRCVVAHTSGATTQPGSGASYTANWEPAALKSISDSVLAGTTYSGGTNSLAGELVKWTKGGFAPTNASLNNAGHDSVTIGAVAYVSAAVTSAFFNPARQTRNKALLRM